MSREAHMHYFGGVQKPWRCHWSDENQKRTFFFRKIVLQGFWGPWLPSEHLIDFANTALTSKDPLEPIYMISEGYRTHTVVTGHFQKIRTFLSGKSCSHGFGAPGCHPGTLIDLVNTALAIKISVEPKCMISEGYRTHGGVTGPIIFKSRTFFFFGKSCSRDFGAPGCHASTLIDLSIIALANSITVETICMISEGYRTHGGVTGPMKFKKKGHFFFGKSCSRDFGAPGCNPCTLIDVANTALAIRSPVKPICMILKA